MELTPCMTIDLKVWPRPWTEWTVTCALYIVSIWWTLVLWRVVQSFNLSRDMEHTHIVVIWQLTTKCDNWQQSVTIDNKVWQLTTKCDNWQQSVTIDNFWHNFISYTFCIRTLLYTVQHAFYLINSVLFCSYWYTITHTVILNVKNGQTKYECLKSVSLTFYPMK